MGEVVPARTSPTLLPHPLTLCCHYPVSKYRSASIVVTSTVRVNDVIGYSLLHVNVCVSAGINWSGHLPQYHGQPWCHQIALINTGSSVSRKGLCLGDQIPTIHQVTAMLATSKNFLFPCYWLSASHQCWVTWKDDYCPSTSEEWYCILISFDHSERCEKNITICLKAWDRIIWCTHYFSCNAISHISHRLSRYAHSGQDMY